MKLQNRLRIVSPSPYVSQFFLVFKEAYIPCVSLKSEITGDAIGTFCARGWE